jgi:predicted nucleic acid-binding protein
MKADIDSLSRHVGACRRVDNRTGDRARSGLAGTAGERAPFKSLWVTAEFSSALSLKQRTRQLDADERADALVAFTRMAAATLTVLPISDLHFHAAARLIDRSAAGLRTPDALHLAVSSGHSETLCTLDRPLAEAGTALGVKTMLV